MVIPYESGSMSLKICDPLIQLLLKYMQVINIYGNFLASVESGNSPVSEKRILQILLDLRFIGDVLSGGKSSSTNTTEMQTKQDYLPSTVTKTSFRRKQAQLQTDSAVIEPINKLINRLSQRLDPIDWAT